MPNAETPTAQPNPPRSRAFLIASSIYLFIVAFISSLSTCGGSSLVFTQVTGVSLLVVVILGLVGSLIRHRRKTPARRCLAAAVQLATALCITSVSSALAQTYHVQPPSFDSAARQFWNAWIGNDRCLP